MAIQIDTGAVSEAAKQIGNLNQKMHDNLSEVNQAVSLLRQNWSGSAATKWLKKYDTIKNDLSNTRFLVVDGLVSFMKNQVGEGYEKTETAVSKAAAAFK